MPYEERCAIRQLAINAVTWTDIVGVAVLPIGCNSVIIYNQTGVNIYLRTDPGNANSQVTIHDGEQFELGGPAASSAGVRFVQNCPAVGSLLSSAGSVSPLIESTF